MFIGIYFLINFVIMLLCGIYLWNYHYDVIIPLESYCEVYHQKERKEQKVFWLRVKIYGIYTFVWVGVLLVVCFCGC